MNKLIYQARQTIKKLERLDTKVPFYNKKGELDHASYSHDCNGYKSRIKYRLIDLKKDSTNKKVIDKLHLAIYQANKLIITINAHHNHWKNVLRYEKNTD